MAAHLAWKLGLGSAGALVALGSAPLGWPWLFPVGLALVVLALVLPAYEGQTLKGKLTRLVRNLPGGRILAARSDPEDEEEAKREA